jgi:molybdenum cofactor cytidylyltransferase
LELKGEEGGKKVILEHRTSVAAIPFPAGSIDIDTAADYEALLSDNMPAG